MKKANELGDFEVKQLTFKPWDGLNLGKLVLRFFDSSDTYDKQRIITYISSIRRSCISRVPTYGFPETLIKITRNTSVAFNNDQMKRHLSFLPLFNKGNIGIDPKIFSLPEKYWFGVDYANPDRPIHEAEQKIEISIDVNNIRDTDADKDVDNESTIKRCNTSDSGFKVYFNDELVEIYDEPIAIIDLLPGDVFKCTMTAVLGVGQKNALWHAATSWHYYDQPEIDRKVLGRELKDSEKVDLERTLNENTLVVISTGLISEYNIVLRACLYIKSQLEKSKGFIETFLDLQKTNDPNVSENEVVIVFKNEDHTIPEIINYELQMHPQIMGSGVAKRDLLVNIMTINIAGKKNTTRDVLRKSILEACDSAITTVSMLYKSIYKVAKANKISGLDEQQL